MKTNYSQTNDPFIDAATEARLLRDLEKREMRAELLDEFRNMLADFKQQLMFDIERMIDGKLAELPTAKPKPETQLNKPLPKPDQISGMNVELCENFHIPAKERGTMPLVQLRIRIDGYRGYWTFPLHRPNHADGRKRIGPLMPIIEAKGRATVKYAGCRQDDTERAYVDSRNQLTMEIAGQSFVFTQPKMKKPDDAPNAPVARWYYPN